MGTIQRWSRISVSFLAILMVLAVLIFGNETHYSPQVRRTVDVTRNARNAHEGMLDQETSLRGYLLSGDGGFLQPYAQGKAQVDALNADEEAFTGVPGIEDLLLEFRLRQAAWIEGWTGEALEAGARIGSSDAVDRQALLVEGRDLFTAYRTAYDALVERLDERRDAALAEQGNAIRVAAGGVAVITVVSGSLMWWRSRALQRTVEPPLDALMEQLASMRTGDFTSHDSIRGPEELERIGTGLRETSDALALARRDAEAHAAQILTHSRQLAQVLRLAREVAGSLNMRYVLRGVCESTSAIADGRRVVVWLRSDEASSVEPRADSGGPGLEPVGLEPVELGDGAVGRAARYGRVEGHVADLIESPDGRVDELAVPMVVGAEVIGVIQICGRGVSALPNDTLDVLEALAVQAASAVSSARLLERTETLAMTDALTHLPNRRQLEADLNTEVDVSVRYNRPLAFAMIDVDNFKDYNDSLGHQAADVALQELARLLKNSARPGDTVYRYGGEELAIILRETTAEAAHHMAERLRATVEHHFAAPSQPRPVTVSAGVAAIPQHGSSARVLVAAADGAMYEAKRSGRNRVCAATVDPVAGHLSGQ